MIVGRYGTLSFEHEGKRVTIDEAWTGFDHVDKADILEQWGVEVADVSSFYPSSNAWWHAMQIFGD